MFTICLILLLLHVFSEHRYQSPPTKNYIRSFDFLSRIHKCTKIRASRWIYQGGQSPTLEILRGEMNFKYLFDLFSLAKFVQWLSSHRQFLDNPLYITGDSYSGKIIPIVVEEVYDGKLLLD